MENKKISGRLTTVDGKKTSFTIFRLMTIRIKKDFGENGVDFIFINKIF